MKKYLIILSLFLVGCSHPKPDYAQVEFVVVNETPQSFVAHVSEIRIMNIKTSDEYNTTSFQLGEQGKIIPQTIENAASWATIPFNGSIDVLDEFDGDGKTFVAILCRIDYIEDGVVLLDRWFIRPLPVTKLDAGVNYKFTISTIKSGYGCKFELK